MNTGYARTSQVRETRGRDSKYSSRVFVYRLEDLQPAVEEFASDSLEAWFGPVDAVQRLIDYRRNS